jgi:hypothetical protein
VATPGDRSPGEGDRDDEPSGGVGDGTGGNAGAAGGRGRTGAAVVVAGVVATEAVVDDCARTVGADVDCADRVVCLCA